jgi:hypothetical protein
MYIKVEIFMLQQTRAENSRKPLLAWSIHDRRRDYLGNGSEWMHKPRPGSACACLYYRVAGDRLSRSSALLWASTDAPSSAKDLTRSGISVHMRHTLLPLM